MAVAAVAAVLIALPLIQPELVVRAQQIKVLVADLGLLAEPPAAAAAAAAGLDLLQLQALEVLEALALLHLLLGHQ